MAWCGQKASARGLCPRHTPGLKRHPAGPADGSAALDPLLCWGEGEEWVPRVTYLMGVW